jgi:hypothetical protein
MDSYRVFVSYSHEDVDLVRKIVAVLAHNGLTAMWDQNLAAGRGFDQQIRTFIAHAHVFLPVLTPSSSARGWVHQEVGYATALRVPVLPVCAGQLPGEMLQQLHAVRLRDDLGDLDVRLRREVFAALMEHGERESRPLFECARLPEDRARMTAEYARGVRDIGGHGCVRCKGRFGPFCTPDKGPNHPVWRERHGDVPRGEEHCRRMRDERRELELHARSAGCRMILNPFLDYGRDRWRMKHARLRTLIDFLESMPDDLVGVAIQRGEQQQVLTILGDWFLAESFAPNLHKGYRQAVYTRHAPTVRAAIREFDEEFEELHPEAGTAVSSRQAAIDVLRGLLAEPEGPAG